MTVMVTRIDKAIVAGFLQAVGVYGALSASGADVQPVIMVVVALAAGVVAGYAVFRVPNSTVAL